LVRLGLSICYDVRFPELYRRLSEQGADVLCVPAAFTRPTGAAHWETLLRARAIENTCYVIAPAQTGTHGKSRTTHGHSLIIDPWGTVLADAQKKPGVIYAEIDTGHIQEIRGSSPHLPPEAVTPVLVLLFVQDLLILTELLALLIDQLGHALEAAVQTLLQGRYQVHLKQHHQFVHIITCGVVAEQVFHPKNHPGRSFRNGMP
jgi:hypothetical protein